MANRRYYRTIILGVMAMGALVWMAIDQFGLSVREMSGLLLDTVLAVGIVIGAAAIGALCLVGLRKLMGREDKR